MSPSVILDIIIGLLDEISGQELRWSSSISEIDGECYLTAIERGEKAHNFTLKITELSAQETRRVKFCPISMTECDCSGECLALLENELAVAKDKFERAKARLDMAQDLNKIK